MHYYQFHPSDYLAKTAHLEPLEDLAYRRLLDLYYQSEAPIPLETQRVSRRLRLGSELVLKVLEEFFKRTENGWENTRCNQQITEYRAKTATARANGKLGGRPRKTDRVILANPDLTQTEPRRKLTSNQEPRTNIEEESKSRALAASAGSRLPQDWTLPADWLEWATAERRDINAQAEAAAFADYWHGVAGARARKSDWAATWRNWIRKASPPRSNDNGNRSKPAISTNFRGKVYAGTPIDQLPPDLRAAAEAAMRDG